MRKCAERLRRGADEAREACALQSFCELFGKGAVRTPVAIAFSAAFSAARRTLFSACIRGRRVSRAGGVSSRCDAPGVWNGGRGGGWTVTAGWTGVSSMTHVSGGTGHPRRTLRLRRLRGIGPQQAIFQRCAIESADDRVHFVRVRRFDEREALGLLRFRIADHFNRVRDQVLGRKPAPDVVRSHPSGQIAQKDGETHSEIIFNSSCGGLLRGKSSMKAIPC